MRNDQGELWENYLMSERIKYLSYTKKLTSHYFWRTYDRQEIDLVEEGDGVLRAFEFKWNSRKKVKIPGGWKKNYPESTFEVVTPDNYLEFITE